MNEFFRWLEANGFKYTRGDMHWAGAGWWYPELPDITTGTEAPKPPEPWIHVEKDRESNAVFIGASYAESFYTEDQKRAQTAVEALLMRIDEVGGSLGGVYPTKHKNVGRRVRVVTWQPQFEGRVYSAFGKWLIVRSDDDDRLVTMTVDDVKFLDEKAEKLDGYQGRGSLGNMTASCDMGAHERCSDIDCDCGCHPFKTCSCGATYSEKQWGDLPWIGEQKIEAGGPDEPEEIWIARNCRCGSTLMKNEA